MAEKTIVEKLQLTKYKEAVILNQPDGADYFQNLANYEEKLADKQYDLIFDFVETLEELITFVKKLLLKINLLRMVIYFSPILKKAIKSSLHMYTAMNSCQRLKPMKKVTSTVAHSNSREWSRSMKRTRLLKQKKRQN